MSETLKLGRVTLASTLGVGLLAAASCWSTAAAQHSKVLSPAKSPMTVQKLQQMSAQARVRTPQLKTLSANIGRMLANSAGSPLPSTDGSNGSAKTANNFGVGANQKNSVFHYSDAWVPSFNTVRHPYRQTGHFLFQASDGNFYRCTASMIARSVMVTAGHCVHDGGNRNAGWIQAGWFYPGRYSENGFPYGFAQTLSVHTTTGWFNTGKLDAGYDVAVAALDVRDGTTTQMGNFVGWYGWCRSGCLQNYWYMTQLGYPGNYYSGVKMTKGEHLEIKSAGGDYTYGSGMQGGSSGGPHIANHGFLLDSTPNKGVWPFRNVVMAVTSWGYADDTVKIQGASSLSGPNNTNNIKTIFNAACTVARNKHGTSACTLAN